MAQITIEMVDQVMERLPYVTYKEAKEALLKTDGDVLEAIIFIESGDDKEDVFEGFEEKFTVETEKIRQQLSDLFKQATVVRVVVEKDSKVMLNIPLSIGVVGVAAMPIVTLLGLSAAVLSRYSVKIVDVSSGQEVDLGSLTPEKMDILKDIIFNSFSNIKESIKKKSNDDNEETKADITDELIKEDSMDKDIDSADKLEK